jgi:hypothetical protein
LKLEEAITATTIIMTITITMTIIITALGRGMVAMDTADRSITNIVMYSIIITTREISITTNLIIRRLMAAAIMVQRQVTFSWALAREMPVLC